MHLKTAAYNQCRVIVDEKIRELMRTLDDLKESIGAETKSSAGDKHETARAHLQIAQEQAGRQLAEVLAQKATLELIDINSISPVVIKGSLIKTNQGYLFMSIAVGKMLVDGEVVIALSPQSPLGMKLIGLRVGDVVAVNGREYVVEGIS